MSAEVVFIAVVVFFVVGVVAGIAVVYALSARRADTAHQPLRPARRAGKDRA